MSAPAASTFLVDRNAKYVNEKPSGVRERHRRMSMAPGAHTSMQIPHEIQSFELSLSLNMSRDLAVSELSRSDRCARTIHFL